MLMSLDPANKALALLSAALVYRSAIQSSGLFCFGVMTPKQRSATPFASTNRLTLIGAQQSPISAKPDQQVDHTGADQHVTDH